MGHPRNRFMGLAELGKSIAQHALSAVDAGNNSVIEAQKVAAAATRATTIRDCHSARIEFLQNTLSAIARFDCHYNEVNEEVAAGKPAAKAAKTRHKLDEFPPKIKAARTAAEEALAKCYGRFTSRDPNWRGRKAASYSTLED